MKVHLVHLGFNATTAKCHTYKALAESGVARVIQDETFLPSGVYDLPDEQWSLESGWVHIQCEKCGIDWWTLTSKGCKVVCPSCENTEDIPLDTILLEDNDE